MPQLLQLVASEEAMESRPGIHRIVLKNRKGFIKAAIRTG